MAEEKKKLLWVGDAVCASGFAKATHEILKTLHEHYEVWVLGINHRGDPHTYPYTIYTAMAGGDNFGAGRINWMCDRMGGADVIVIQQDGWNLPYYTERLALVPEHAKIPVIAAVAVDGKNFCGAWLKGIALAVFWTQFAKDEARAGGYEGPATVIPLGVDLEMYHPMDKYEVRGRRFPRNLDDAFIVGNVNRNQPRKRWDLTIKYFAEWIHTKKIRDAWLYLHIAPTGEMGIDIKPLASYYDIIDRLALGQAEMWYGASEDEMREIYNCFDVNMTTTAGEGFGLTAMEAMACGIPCIMPEWSGLGDWAKGAAWMVPCSTTHIGPPYVNVIGGVPDQGAFTMGLNRLYSDKAAREQNAQAALERAQEPRFRWESIGEAWHSVIDQLLTKPVCEHQYVTYTIHMPQGYEKPGATKCAKCGEPKPHLQLVGA